MSKMAKTIAVLGVVAGLGAAAMPLSSFADTQTTGVTITATVGETISLAVDSDTAAIGSVVTGAASATEKKITATVTTNNAAGYDLKIVANGEGTGAASATDMVRINADTTIDNDNVIPALAGDAASATGSWWGYKIGDAGTWTGVTASDVTINSANTQVTDEETEIVFGVKAVAGQLSGNYRGKVTLTAITK